LALFNLNDAKVVNCALFVRLDPVQIL